MGIHEEKVKYLIQQQLNATSAAPNYTLEEELKKETEELEKEEQNNPTNQNLRYIISQNEEQIKLLINQNKSLESQLSVAKESEKSARNEAKRSRILSIISVCIALSSLLATILIAILKQ